MYALSAAVSPLDPTPSQLTSHTSAPTAEAPPASAPRRRVPTRRATITHASPAPTPAPSLELVVDGRYQLVRYLARGATASIYLAEDRVADRMVVVKLLDSAATDDEELRRRFLEGARAVLSLKHPNTVRIYSAESPEGCTPYVVMEALAGESLGDLLRRTPAIAPELALHLARHVAAGLAGMHRAGMVHCDVKPDNVFLVGRIGAPKSAKLLDFGLTKPIGSVEDEDFVLGTAQYMAPEQIVGDAVDARTDVYSLGAVLFRLFTAQLPFDLDLCADLLRHHVASPAPPPSWLREELPLALETVILKALRKNPEQRYQTMRELIRDLDAVAHGKPVQATRDESAERAPYAPRSARAVRSLRMLAKARF
jgi:serine/threonine-protein kinase